MRKTVSIVTVTLVLFSMLVFVGGCKKKAGVTGPTAELFALLPANSTGVVAINFKKIAGLPSFDKIIKEMETQKAAAKVETPQEEPAPAEGVESETTEGEAPVEAAPEVKVEPELFESYSDFIKKTGIDPKKDLNAVAMAFTGKMSMGSSNTDALIVIQVNYNKSTIVNFVKSQGSRYAEEVYNNINVFTFKDAKGIDKAFAFINDNTLATGNMANLKQVIDLSKGTGKSILTNETMAPYFKRFKSEAMASFVFEIPAEERKVVNNPMMKFDFTKAEAVVGNFDYSSSTFQIDVLMINKNKAANDMIVTTLNGFKAMGAMAGPEYGELLNNIILTANDEGVVMKLSITETLLEKLQKKMGEKKAAGMGM